MASFNIFEPPTKCDIKVGYISTDRGYVSGIGIHDANVYAKKNPGTTFIFATREKLQYLNINEVNKLTPNDLVSSVDSCTGIEINKKSDESPQIVFSGGGGIGAKANPIIGADGSLIGIDLVTGGFGYQYPPQVSMLDPTGIGAGAVIRAGIASTATVYQTYEDEEDFEEYDLKTCAPPNVGFGSMYVGGKNIGTWNPNQYLNSTVSPFEIEVRKYISELQNVQNPWWTTHKEVPKKVTGNGKTSRTYYKVNRPYWREFLNSYGISPVPPSNAKGSDFAGKWYTFEWDVEFPYDGEYRFVAQCDNDARLFIDNETVSEFKIGEGGAAGSVLSNPLKFKQTITGGDHNLRLELYNHPIKEKVSVQGSDAIRQETRTTTEQQTIVTQETVVTQEERKSTRQVTQVAGADFVKKSNGYYMLVGGNVETEVSLTMTYNDNPRTAGTAITKITIPNPDGDDLILEREKTGSGRFKQSGSVSTKAVFKRSGSGYGPFMFEGNDGSNKLVGKNVAYGVNSTRYGQIDFLDRHGSDINASLKILSTTNLQSSRTVETTEMVDVENVVDVESVVDVEVTSSEIVTAKKLSSIFNTVDYIDKANRKLWRTNVNNNGGFVNEYGVCPFDTLNTLPDNPYAGTHQIKWNNITFPVSGNYVIEIGVDDNVILKIGDQVEIRKDGYAIEGGRNKSTGVLREVRYIKQGTYKIIADLEQTPGGRFGFGKIRQGGAIHDYSGKGLNPMALAINIETSFEEKLKVSPKTWNENPMGVALSIEAPAPPIPQQPAPVQEGRCPPNPFWTTRAGGAKNQWHPVVVDGWSTFLNKYAMSPVPPFEDGSTSGGGILFENEWSVQIPYDGFYKLKGEADDIANFFVDDKLVLGTSRRENKVRGESKFFLSEGTKRIRVQVENYLFEERQLIDQKIFSTADWVNAAAATNDKTTTVNFKVTTASAFINSIEIKGLFYEQGGEFVAGEETPPPQVKPAIDAGVNFIKKGDQYFMTVTGNDLIEVTFNFRYHVDDVNRGGGISVRGITIQTEGAPLTFRRTDGPRLLTDGWPGRGGSVIKKATFKNGKEYPISFTGRISGAPDPIIDAAGSLDNTSREMPNRRLNFFDRDTSDGATAGADSFGDTRAHFTATNVRQLSEPGVETFAPVPKTQLRQLDGKPPITKEVEIGKEYVVEIKNAGQGLMGNTPAPLAALKVDGGVVTAEDLPNTAAGAQGGVTFDDITCAASQGRFFDINKNTCKFIVDRKAPTAQGIVTGGTVRDGATYSGPKLATYAKGELGPFLSPFHTTAEEIQGKTWVMKWNNVNFPEAGQYSIRMQADDVLKVRVNGRQVGIAKVREGLRTHNFNIATKGSKTLELELSNIRIANTTFTQNPTVAAAIITRKVSVAVKKDGKIQTKSWKENPIGVSGILIPPPCPKTVGGTGVVGPVIPTVPGNGYEPPTGPGYPVGLKLKEIIVDDPGINYNFDDPIDIDGPATAHICEMDSFGRIKKVCLGETNIDDETGDPRDPEDDGDDDGSGEGGSRVGFTKYPNITINSSTGSSARLIPVMEIVRDPVDPAIDPDKLIQVTDLVGINQTGYYDGRAYYGAVFYKDGLKYAGYYETAGQLVQIYDTLQESIDAEVTTPPSAILRQGTDISSDDPRLDIPGTPDYLI